MTRPHRTMTLLALSDAPATPASDSSAVRTERARLTALAQENLFFCCERLSASMARSLHLSFICIPQSARALDQGGVEPRQAVSPKALRPWTIPLRYSVGCPCSGKSSQNCSSNQTPSRGSENNAGNAA